MPEMERRGGGSFIITSSIAGVKGSPNVSAYITSKHAVIGLMKSAAREGAPKNIRVNTVNPSPVETPNDAKSGRSALRGNGDKVKPAFESSIPLGRYADPLEVAKLMLFLASDDSEFITGSVYMIDGGSSA